MSTFKVTCAGGTQSPTGSNFLVELGDKKILIDCGLHQGEKVSLDDNREAFSYAPAGIDMLFVTHGHLDHVGRIPKLIKDGFHGTIYSTAPTRDIAELIMLDSMGVLEKEAQREGKEPLYEEKHVFEAMRRWKTVAYHEEVVISVMGDHAIIQYFDAGHILGSGMVVIKYKGKRLAFTGDLGNTPSPLMCDTEKLTGIDYLFMESVYGDRNHEDYMTRVALLKETIIATIKKNGVLMIPAFSVERTQEIIFYFNSLVEQQQIPQVPVYLDSPLGINVTEVYKKYEHLFNENVVTTIKKGDDIFAFKGLVITRTTEESKRISEEPSPKIIIAGSGMSNGGRIVHHETQYLPDPNNTLLLVGYQAAGTPGRRIADGAKKVVLQGVEVPIRAKVMQIHGFSAHKDSDHLIAFAGAMRDTLKKVFIILGEPDSSYFLAQRLYEEYDYKVSVPKRGEVIELE
jgi:metallo-beta-lactamase family protein